MLSLADRARKLLRATSHHLEYPEIHCARLFHLRNLQKSHFSQEIAALQRATRIPVSSTLKALCPFLDQDGLLRVGGRLHHAPIPFDERRPIILLKHQLSKLIAIHAHLRSLHEGPQLTLRVLRQNYWMLGAGNLVKNITHQCVKCVRERAAVPQQLMGNLLSARVQPTRPFLHAGIDYAGPFYVKSSKARNALSHKAYIVLFICLATHAVHLELVSDYSTDSFIAALRRFVARRGYPSDIYSDNGTNFHGADRELHNLLHDLHKDDQIYSFVANQSITWHFILPASPHFGGLWEAGVKSAKHHLRRVVGSQVLTFEELSTFLAQVEVCLNSRPISPLSTDVSDLACLTPGHFLTGTSLLAILEPSLLDVSVNRLSPLIIDTAKIGTILATLAIGIFA